MAQDLKVKYSDSDLAEFKELIEEKIVKAKSHLAMISKHVPQTKKPLEIYRLKVTNIYTNTRNSYTKFIVPSVNKLFNLE